MSLTIEEVMCDEQRLELPLQRELEWESRHNYINSMLNELYTILPANGQPDNLTEARRCLAQVLTRHDQRANEAIEMLGRRQYEELGVRNTAHLTEFELQLQMQLLKLLQKQAPKLLQWLRSGGEDFALATAMTVGAMTGEQLPILTKTASTRDARLVSNSKVKLAPASSPFDTKHRTSALASFDVTL